MPVKPTVMVEMSTAACLLKDEAPVRREWVRGSEMRRPTSATPSDLTGINSWHAVIFPTQLQPDCLTVKATSSQAGRTENI